MYHSVVICLSSHVTDYNQSQFSEFSVFFVCPPHGVTEALRHHFVEDPKALKAAGVRRSPRTTNHRGLTDQNILATGDILRLKTLVLMSQGEK